MMSTRSETAAADGAGRGDHPEARRPGPENGSGPAYVQTDALRSGEERGGCLRPLGMCELGGCCDLCWHGAAYRRKRAAAGQ